MVVKVEIFKQEVTITDGVAKCKNELLQKLVNELLQGGEEGSTSDGYLPQLFNPFGDLIKLVSVDGIPEDAIF